MPSPTLISFAKPPAMLPSLTRALFGRKPYIASDGVALEALELEARRIVLSGAHLQRYRDACGVRTNAQFPPAYLHVVAMPLHMQLFIAKQFPVKVLGLIHLRNTIRVLSEVNMKAPLRLRVNFDTMRLTDFGQEYDFTTRFEQDGTVVWEEVSTMFARGAPAPKDATKRPSIERSAHPASGVATETLDIVADTGWRYARVSGDFNPIHLTARTAQMFGFKQAVSHGMWSLARCLAAAAPHMPNGRIQIDTQFKLPVYLPSQALARTWPVDNGVNISMCTPRGDRLHLSMQVRTIT